MKVLIGQGVYQLDLLELQRLGITGKLFEIRGSDYTIRGFGPVGGGFKLGIGAQYTWGKTKFID